ncbi:Ion transport 2 domain-containing protein [Flavobacterium limnosediminis JC2902]|uniref:Ion transport 2 domain-containing protein n=1 Tax=Flavobacterium limnosediminis JC2902 TaxID=1341181 RepID=V6STZ4_9FLAO|nr:potassium channel family protein [Flavobacterium limnosediminis]ESU29939.1 Ion transport 2 domain-containing protein [Flavobacterium limnosediminis JC2902]
MVKAKKYRLFNHLWDKEDGLLSMLVLLFIMHFLFIPLFGNHSFLKLAMQIFWVLFLLSGIFALGTSKKQASLISIIPVLFVIVGWISLFDTSNFIIITDFVLSLAVLLLLITLVLIKVFEPGPVTIFRVAGSVVVYMLMASLWSIIYLFLFQRIDGSFQITLPPFERNSLEANFLYFSYITITTTGYGEILPLHPFARSMVQMEAIFGVLYPVILIGRLVSDSNTPDLRKNKT